MYNWTVMVALLLFHLFLCILLLLRPATAATAKRLSASNGPQKRARFRSSHCHLLRGMGAGVPRNQSVQCKYNPADDTFYQRITWKSPVGGHLPPKGYMVRILYGSNHQMCFHFNSSVNQLHFDAAEGFRQGRSIRVSVIAEPVDRRAIIKNIVQKSLECPPKLKLRPIQNKYVLPGANTSFQCAFVNNKFWWTSEYYHQPILNYTVAWYFSSNFRCRSSKRIRIHESKHFRLTNSNHMLQLINANREHEGCYTLQVTHASGSYYYGKSARYRDRYDLLEVRSYLYLNNTQYSTFVHKPLTGYLGIKMQLFIALTVGAGIFVVIAFAIMARLCFKKHYLKLRAPAPEQPCMKVYISHALEGSADLHMLLKFASVLQAHNVNVIVDVCSEVQINSCGGLSRWVPGNIKNADKIVVVLSDRYVTMLCEEGTEKPEPNGTVCKVHAEYTYVSNIVHNSLHKSNRVVLLSKGVKPAAFPVIFENKIFYEFPKNLSSAWNSRDGLDSCTKDIVEALLGKSV